MCEVGSCCGCFSLYKGCILIGLVTIAVSLVQATIFSLILYESYVSLRTSAPVTKSINKSLVDKGMADSSLYSFSSPLCPFGFIPMTKKIRNETYGENATLYDLDDGKNVTAEVNRTLAPNSSDETTKVTCLAPTQGVLLSLVIASCFYAPVGVILIIGIRTGATVLLSTWFFYTVAYNLLALIVALTDGVYIGAADVSSYIVCLVTAYCVIVVDSYYEKLLRNEKVEENARARPSLTVVKSSPVSTGNSPGYGSSSATPSRKGSKCPSEAKNENEANELLLPPINIPAKSLSPV